MDEPTGVPLVSPETAAAMERAIEQQNTPFPSAEAFIRPPKLEDWMLKDIAERDAQTEPQIVSHLLPLGQSGTKYDHARLQTSDYHLDTDELALGDRHLLLLEVRRLRAESKVAHDAYDAWARYFASDDRRLVWSDTCKAMDRLMVALHPERG